MYIVSQRNLVDLNVLRVIVTSIISIVYGMTQAAFSQSYSRERYENREIRFHLVFLPPIFIKFMAFVPPVAFFASLKGHSNPAYLAFIIYFFVQVFFSALAFDTSNEPGAKTWKKMMLAFQVGFTFIAVHLSTSWIVSLYPYLNPSSAAILPGFATPNSSFISQDFVINDDTFANASWAKCNVTHENYLRNSSKGDTLSYNWEQRYIDIDINININTFCLTNIATELYIFFFSLAIMDSAYTIILIPVWPILKQKCFQRKIDTTYA